MRFGQQDLRKVYITFPPIQPEMQLSISLRKYSARIRGLVSCQWSTCRFKISKQAPNQSRHFLRILIHLHCRTLNKRVTGTSSSSNKPPSQLLRSPKPISWKLICLRRRKVVMERRYRRKSCHVLGPMTSSSSLSKRRLICRVSGKNKYKWRMKQRRKRRMKLKRSLASSPRKRYLRVFQFFGLTSRSTSLSDTSRSPDLEMTSSKIRPPLIWSFRRSSREGATGSQH